MNTGDTTNKYDHFLPWESSRYYYRWGDWVMWPQTYKLWESNQYRWSVFETQRRTDIWKSSTIFTWEKVALLCRLIYNYISYRKINKVQGIRPSSFVINWKRDYSVCKPHLAEVIRTILEGNLNFWVVVETLFWRPGSEHVGLEPHVPPVSLPLPPSPCLPSVSPYPTPRGEKPRPPGAQPRTFPPPPRFLI